MSAYRSEFRLFFLAIMLSAACLGGMVYVDASLVATLLALAIFLGWALLCWKILGCQSSLLQKQKTELSSNIQQVASQTSELFGKLQFEFDGQFGLIKSENNQMQEILADAIGKLVPSFTKMEDLSRQQQKLALSLTATGHGAGSASTGDVDFGNLLLEIEGVLQSLLGSADENSQSALVLVGDMERASSQFEEVLGMLGEIKKIADQTNLLAINANVEAARAGQFGRGFSVVAEEVRNLSIHSTKFSDQIYERVEGITKALHSVEKSIKDMAKKEQRLASTASSQVNELVDRTRQFNSKVEESAERITSVSEQVGTEVSSAVTSLQFQDMATQVISHVDSRLNILSSVLCSMASLPLDGGGSSSEAGEGLDAHLRELATHLGAASKMVEEARHNPVSQKNLDVGEVELF